MIRYSLKWIMQRITAILLIPLIYWFIYNCIFFSKASYNELINFFNSYLNSSLFLIMMVSMLIHVQFGCETIVEDYISALRVKNITIYSIRVIIFFTIVITVISTLSIIK